MKDSFKISRENKFCSGENNVERANISVNENKTVSIDINSEFNPEEFQDLIDHMRLILEYQVKTLI